ncbi:hypothetical protein TeGR_g4767, partial [Tetraparma gracilis]
FDPLVTVTGYVTNMDSYMRAADIMVTKAGPGTLAEACILGLPVIMSSYLPGQEAGNLKLVEEQGWGEYLSEFEEIGFRIEQWLGDEALVRDMGERARAASDRTATTRIAQEIGDLCMQRFEERKQEVK